MGCASALFRRPASPSQLRSPPSSPRDASRTPSRNSSRQLGGPHDRRVAIPEQPISAIAAAQPCRCCRCQSRAPASWCLPTLAICHVSDHPRSAYASHPICSRDAPRTDRRISQTRAHRTQLPTLHPHQSRAPPTLDSTCQQYSQPAVASS